MQQKSAALVYESLLGRRHALIRDLAEYRLMLSQFASATIGEIQIPVQNIQIALTYTKQFETMALRSFGWAFLST